MKLVTRAKKVRFWVLVVLAAVSIFVLAGNLIARLVLQC